MELNWLKIGQDINCVGKSINYNVYLCIFSP